MNETFVVGIDLSGPSNSADTVAAGFRMGADGTLQHRFTRGGLGDEALRALLDEHLPTGARMVAGLDAPLSYNPGGGDRPSDRELRRCLVAAGLPSGTVMTPTMSRMVYLTLRGIVVARNLSASRPGCAVVEVHPGGAMVLRGAPADTVRTMKRSARSRRSLRTWLGTQGLKGMPSGPGNDHTVAAYAAALAAWGWHVGQRPWTHPARPPGHPYDFAC